MRTQLGLSLCWVAAMAAILFTASTALGQQSESTGAGPGTLSYQVVTTTGTCGQYNSASYTLYEFENFSFSAPGFSQALSGGGSYNNSPSANGVSGCPPNGWQPNSTTPLVLTGSGYTIDFTGIGSYSGTATYVGPFATLSTNTISFGTVGDGTTATQNVTLSNTGTSTLTINAIGASGAGFSQTNNCGTALNAGASCTISISFQPTNLAQYSGSLSISTNGPVTSFTVSLSGTGGIAATLALPASAINSGTYFYAATGTITAGTGGYTIGGSASVTMSAGQSVTLMPGFDAKAGTATVTFHALIQTFATDGNGPTLVIDVPQANGFLTGSVVFSGWATDPIAHIRLITLNIDGSAIGSAWYGLSRPDVCSSGQGPNCPNVGWSFPFNTSSVADGLHTLTVTAYNDDYYNPLSATVSVSFVSSKISGTVATMPANKEFVYFGGSVIAVENH